MDWRNRWVHFRVCDVYVPEPGQLLVAIHGSDVLQGKVMEIVEGEAETGVFAVVHVDHPAITQPLIVSIQKICGEIEISPDAPAN